jgi:hypothetical protein
VQINLNVLVGIALCFLPLVLAIMIVFRKQERRRATGRAPFKELLRRPAGETLRIKIEDLNDKNSDQISMLVFFPTMMAAGLLFIHPVGYVVPVSFCVISAIWVGVWGTKTFRTLRERANYKLGFDGERYVAEELSRLNALGFEIYHDVPFDNFNIDHVLVGPPGVFVVETKTRRKPVDESGTKEYRFLFEGNCLQWPWGAEGHGIKRAANNARTMAKWLSGAVGQTVAATAILTLPGWMVDRKAPYDDVYVLNPKEIHQVCSGPEQNSQANLLAASAINWTKSVGSQSNDPTATVSASFSPMVVN